MALNAKTVKATGGDRVAQALVPKGNHFARIAQVIDLGLQARKAWKGTVKPPVHQLWVTYELVNSFMIDKNGKEDKEQPRWISERMNLFSLSQENATSTKRMEALDADGSIDGDWGRVGGLPCTLTVTHSKDGKYNNIGAISPPMAGIDVPELVNDVRIFDIDEPDMEVYEGLPDFLKTIMSEGLEFKGSRLAKLLDGEVESSVPSAPEEEVPEDDDTPY